MAVDAPPTVELTSPVAGSLVKLPLLMAARATDDRGVAKVEFFVDGKLIGTDTSAPFSVTAKRIQIGWRTATARAYDTGGLSTVTASVRFRI